MKEILKKTLVEQRNLMTSGEVDPKELFKYCYEQIQSSDLNSFIGMNEGYQEHFKQQLQKDSKTSKLWGLPLGIKDIICTEGIKTTAASKLFKNFTPSYNATLVNRLLKEGALILGKNNSDELAMGCSGENSYFGPSKNPWNHKMTTGGSSSGSSASVAGHLCSASIGTDTGGSIRLPSHFCGLAGLRTTYGRISRFGIYSFASSLDQAGPMTRWVEDSALLYEVMAGRDERDATSSFEPVTPWKYNPKNLKGKKVAILNLSEELPSYYSKSLQESVKILEAQGAEVETLHIPEVNAAISMYYLICCIEASSNYSRYDGFRYGGDEELDKINFDFYSAIRKKGLGTEVKKRILLGTFCLSEGFSEEYYEKAMDARKLLISKFKEVFQKIDLLVLPTGLDTAFPLGEKKSSVQKFLNDRYTCFVNIIGSPALTVPYGLEKSMPYGIQLVSAPYQENLLFDAGKCLELSRPVKEFDCETVTS